MFRQGRRGVAPAFEQRVEWIGGRMHGRNAPRVGVAVVNLDDERNRRRMTPAAGSITPASAKALQFSRRGTARKL
jgi:hypothetical protein